MKLSRKVELEQKFSEREIKIGIIGNWNLIKKLKLKTRKTENWTRNYRNVKFNQKSLEHETVTKTLEHGIELKLTGMWSWNMKYRNVNFGTKTMEHGIELRTCN